MSIGPDIKEVLTELGTPVTLYPYAATPVPAGNIDFVAFTDQSTVFIRMFVHLASVAYDTIINAGDVVSWSGKFYIATNKKAVEFEGTVIEYEILFYLCNIVGTLQRYTTTPTYDANYQRVESWVPYAENFHATLVEKTLAKTLTTNAEISSESNVSDVLYISGVHDVKTGDRLILEAGRVFQIMQVDDFMIEGIKVCMVYEDSRG